jgi:hypothetical protein
MMLSMIYGKWLLTLSSWWLTFKGHQFVFAHKKARQSHSFRQVLLEDKTKLFGLLQCFDLSRNRLAKAFVRNFRDQIFNLGHKSETREGKYCAEEYPFRIYKSAAFCREKILGREDVSRARCVAGLSGLS